MPRRPTCPNRVTAGVCNASGFALADLHPASPKILIKIRIRTRSGMRKEYVVKSIDSAPDGQPYVIVSLMSAKDMREGVSQPQSPFDGPKVMGFTDMNDMMKDINKMFSGMSGHGMAGVTSIKLDMHEYKEMSLAVGDKMYIDLTKAESLGV